MEILTLEKLKSGDFKVEEVYSQYILSCHNEFATEIKNMVNLYDYKKFTITNSHRVGVVLLLIKCGFTIKDIIANIERPKEQYKIEPNDLVMLDQMDFVTFTLDVNLLE